jgi:hypothetical protein
MRVEAERICRLAVVQVAVALAAIGCGGSIGSTTGGSTGTAGTTGAAGTTGSAGTTGNAGTTGRAGTTGSAGTTGGGGAAGCTPDYACKPTAPSTGDYYADCVARVNQFRACVCLPPLARWNAGEACADMDSSYDATQNSAHAGFIAGICSPEGNAQDECPGWQTSTMVVSQCLQQMYDEGPPPTNPCDGACYQAHGHFINMTNTSYTMVACGIATVNGKVTAVQDFR